MEDDTFDDSSIPFSSPALTLVRRRRRRNTLIPEQYWEEKDKAHCLSDKYHVRIILEQ